MQLKVLLVKSNSYSFRNIGNVLLFCEFQNILSQVVCLHVCTTEK